MELEHGRVKQYLPQPWTKQGVRHKNQNVFSFGKTLFDTTLYLLLGKIFHPKLVFVNEIFFRTSSLPSQEALCKGKICAVH